MARPLVSLLSHRTYDLSLRWCQVLTLANLAQIVNVLQAVVMTEGPRFWRTPTYHALRLHAPHLGATALPVVVMWCAGAS